jgi:acetylornithine/succinyldiaminopimelate/putrescine aminotransferase
MKKYDLVPLDAVAAMPHRDILDLYRRHVAPGILANLKILGFDRVRVVRAEGMWLHTADGRRILDFSAGMNVLNHGHNHPRVVAARRRFDEERGLEVCKAFVPAYQAVLARNIAAICPGGLQYSFFANSGAEANEGALKIAQVFHGKARDKFLYTDLGYHGKTFGTLSVSGPFGKPYKELFKGLDGCIQVPWGDLEATRRAIEGRTTWGRCDIAAMILEPVKGDLAMLPPAGYLEALVDLLHEHGILAIFDEIFTGFGRTGRMWGFEHTAAVPDILTFSKSLGGGKASIAGYIVPKRVFDRTYASPTRCAIHSTTFGGLGGECAAAIEALNVLLDEGLVDRSRELGAYMLERMRDVQARHPRLIKEVRSVGLLGVMRTARATELLDARLLRVNAVDDLLEGLIPGLVVSELLKRHDVLIYTGGREDNLFVNPALIVKRDEIDLFFDKLDAVLSSNLARLAAGLAANWLPSE